MRWVVACDHAGVDLKVELARWLQAQGHEVSDLGVHTNESVDYPDPAHALAKELVEGRAERGVLVCGSGIGVSIAANRHKGVRAALCTNEWMAELSRQHNDANVLCLGARVVGAGLAQKILEAFAATDFEGGRHTRRVEKIDAC